MRPNPPAVKRSEQPHVAAGDQVEQHVSKYDTWPGRPPQGAYPGLAADDGADVEGHRERDDWRSRQRVEASLMNEEILIPPAQALRNRHQGRARR